MTQPARFISFTPIVLWLGVICTGALALYGTRPPRAVDVSGPKDSFSAARAITHLAQIARQPHPIGSDEAVRVREYLIGQLRELGGEVNVEQAIGTVHYGRVLHSGLV